MTASQLQAELQKYASDSDAVVLQRFFKTGPGEYGEGDVFIGVRVPNTRKVCKQFVSLAYPEIQKLLDSPIHEHRLAGLIILSYKYPKSSEPEKKEIFEMYLRNVAQGRVNNWDLVDVTAPGVVGEYLVAQSSHQKLIELAQSDNLWEKRVAMIASFAFIKKGSAGEAIDIAEILLHDQHDLIQKAVGWMLREVGKRIDEAILLDFLDEHAHEMPRTQLRYAIEKLSDKNRQYYMGLGR